MRDEDWCEQDTSTESKVLTCDERWGLKWDPQTQHRGSVLNRVWKGISYRSVAPKQDESRTRRCFERSSQRMVLMRATVASENLLTLGTRFYDHQSETTLHNNYQNRKTQHSFHSSRWFSRRKGYARAYHFFSLCRKYLHFSNIGENL